MKKNKILILAALGVLVIGSLGFSASKKQNFRQYAQTKNSKRTKISAARAKQIALARVPGATSRNIVDFDVDHDSYEGEIVYRGMEYNFEINAYTGRIVDWDVDRND